MCTPILAAVVAVPAAYAQFETRGSFVAETYPYSIAIGDFNHDGKLDLAVVSACCPSGGVSILLGRGDGTFQSTVNYPAGVSPESVVAIDLNHDGNLDLAVASQSAYISILLGNGDGTFQNATVSPAVPTFERYIATGDFNGDGRPDLVMRADQSAVTVLLGNGDGTFQNALITYAPFDVEALGVGDFNHDGKLDLATGGTFGSSSTLNVWIGNGNGTFAYGASYNDDESPRAIAVADFNRDGNLDLGIINLGDVEVMLGNGDGTFQPAVATYAVAVSSWGVAGDFNGDGKLDLAIVGSFQPAGVTVLPGNGDGTFGSGAFFPTAGDPYYAAVGDFNGDGKEDIAVPDHQHNDVILLLNTGKVSFAPTTPLNFNRQGVGTTSSPKTVTLTNTGKTAMTVSSMKAAGQFGMTSTCGGSVAPGANCTISVTFSPKAKGAKSGTVTINDSASSKPQVIELSGTGT